MSTKGRSTKDVAAQRGVAFERIEPLRAHEYVAVQIRRHIGLGLIGVGEALPPARELARMFGVGPSTIQAAIRMLESDRLIESRRGRRGGTFVIDPQDDEAGLERSLLELKLSRKQVEEALRFRRIVEEGAVRLAAECGKPENFDALRTIADEMSSTDDERDFHRLDTEFHVGIAIASQNDLLRTAVEQARLRLNDAILVQPESELWQARIRREHEAILAAIFAGDAKGAVRTMGKHLTHTEKSINALIVALG